MKRCSTLVAKPFKDAQKKLQPMRLPEGKALTIGIGVLCSSRGRETPCGPDTILMLADTMGSTDTDSTNELGKMFVRPDQNLYAVAAGSIPTASMLFHTMAEGFEGIKKERGHGSFWHSLNRSVNGIRSELFKWNVLHANHVVGNEAIGTLCMDKPENILEAWRTYDFGVQMLLATFGDDGRALLYFIGSTGQPEAGFVHFVEFPGHFSIGAGAPNAEAWLNFRGQRLDFSVERSLYHAYEASLMAASAPSVNEQIEVDVITKAGFSSVVSFDELKALNQKYGPQNTADLKFPTPLTLRTSKDQP